MGQDRVEDTDLEGVRVSDTDGEGWFGDENLVWSDDELNSNKGSDANEPNIVTFPVFNPSCIFDPYFELGMIFSTKDEFRTAVQSHAIQTKRNIKFTKNDKKYVHAKCFDKECNWRIHACQVKGECTFQIKGPLNIWDEHLESPPFGGSHHTGSRITTLGEIAG
ncbi:UNVERIFIED_CONTAM: hypothetical protein Slati_1409100 [Sesamum latifolium]|uniref:Transposase MuDR plant domain-containing protein n=1 Tax=Sesamum latifolium TaxID=2727402 RepID=A0AAW2X2T8_9LAMI